eukprot:scaffold199283_cov27-Tisochrysis_lutea.AAC.1
MPIPLWQMAATQSRRRCQWQGGRTIAPPSIAIAGVHQDIENRDWGADLDSRLEPQPRRSAGGPE